MTDFEAAFVAARRLCEQGRLADAERVYRRLARESDHRARALRALAALYLQSARREQALEVLGALAEEQPDNPVHYWELADLLQSSGRHDAAIAQYERLLRRRPDYAAGYFNLGILCKRALRFRDSLAAYERAVELGLDNVAEAYSNMGVVYSEMRDADNARAMYEQALATDAGYVPALYNLAVLCEEAGEKGRAKGVYERILAADSRQWSSLARLAELEESTDASAALIDRLRAAVGQAEDPLAKEGLYFALGKLLDQSRRYEEAYAAYKKGNSLSKRRNAPYDAEATARAFDQLINYFSPSWIRRNETASDASPVFICGMFRSGSTLVERMLAGHPQVTAGGELDFLPWLISRDLAPYPQRIDEMSPRALQALSDEYVSKTRELFPHAAHLTDKRPDNFLHLGLVKAMFPRARIVYTRRHRLDNCLSVYFQQLGGKLSYAADLNDTAHYYSQHVRLMNHWMSCFGESIFTVDYDELVRTPEPILRRLLSFLGLPWDEKCLQFTRAEGLVKTASLWQVREGLQTSSSGRWRNYRTIIPELDALSDTQQRTG